MDAVTIHRLEPTVAAADPSLPPEAPLQMPVQALGASPGNVTLPSTSPPSMPVRRVLLLLTAVGLTAAFAYEMYRVLDIGGLTGLEITVLGLFVLLSGWIAFSFTSSLAGLPGLLLHRRITPLGIDPRTPLPSVSIRVALLLPTYNEDPHRVFAGLSATLQSLAATGQGGQFDAFVLSDTTNADVWVAEADAYRRLRRKTAFGGRLFYRRRLHNTDRKAGNVGEWVRRFGGAYEAMIVLDADSVMRGEGMVRLAAAMEAHPRVGLIQTLPAIVRGRTLFARTQQFAAALYGPLLAHGLAAWHGSESNYWGHNAIIRTRAFAEAAGLPHMPGPPPFGGHILSHDFIEAALLRRAGWAVHLVPSVAGSYEEGPASAADLIVRDRRWCQGNLQHAGVLPARGLHWVSRLHLLIGIGSYITAPLWLMMLVAGLLVALQARFVPPDYFPGGFSLFPDWPAQDPVRAAWVFVATMGALLAPKLIALLALVFDGPRRRGFGGFGRATIGVLVETLVTGLMAPVMMVLQTACVVDVLRGRDGGWSAQRRDDGRLPVSELFRLYGPATVLGALLGGAAWAISLPLLLWMSPVIAGLLLAIPLALVTSSRAVGGVLKLVGVLATPEERSPPEELAELTVRLAAPAPALAGNEAVRALAADDDLFALHLGMLPDGGRRPAGDVAPERLVARAKAQDADCLADALAAFTPREKTAALADSKALDRLIELAAKETAAPPRAPAHAHGT
jgi:membrane glycosyltransferase